MLSRDDKLLLAYLKYNMKHGINFDISAMNLGYVRKDIVEKERQKLIEKLTAKNKWHYISEKGLPEADQYYFIAYTGPLGISTSYCKLVRRSEQSLPVYDKEGRLVRMPLNCLRIIKEWDCPEDAEAKAWLNEKGRVYAWMPSPALPEVK